MPHLFEWALRKGGLTTLRDMGGTGIALFRAACSFLLFARLFVTIVIRVQATCSSLRRTRKRR